MIDSRCLDFYNLFGALLHGPFPLYLSDHASAIAGGGVYAAPVQPVVYRKRQGGRLRRKRIFFSNRRDSVNGGAHGARLISIRLKQQEP
jgi:hypothetical protein